MTKNLSSVSVNQPVISAEAAHQALEAAVAHAKELGIQINVAITDRAGMPGAFLHSVEIAIDKAYTAASFGFPTSGWMDAIRNDETLKIGLPARPRLVIFGGGLPIVADGVRIGGIGVSGGTAEEDEQCAAAALKAIGLA